MFSVFKNSVETASEINSEEQSSSGTYLSYLFSRGQTVEISRQFTSVYFSGFVNLV